MSYYETHSEKVKKYSREWRKANPLKAKLRDQRKGARLYGITLEQRDELEKTQDGKCAICGKEETATIRGKVKRLAVDHCHQKNQVRGLLCDRCNRGLGFFLHNEALLVKASEYLTKPPAARVLGKNRLL